MSWALYWCYTNELLLEQGQTLHFCSCFPFISCFTCTLKKKYIVLHIESNMHNNGPANAFCSKADVLRWHKILGKQPIPIYKRGDREEKLYYAWYLEMLWRENVSVCVEQKVVIVNAKLGKKVRLRQCYLFSVERRLRWRYACICLKESCQCLRAKTYSRARRGW